MNTIPNRLQSIVSGLKQFIRPANAESGADIPATHDFIGMVSERREGGRIHLGNETIAIASNFVIVDSAFRQHDIGAGVLIAFTEPTAFEAGDTMWLAPSRILICEG